MKGTEKELYKFGEIQYIRGRLDELFKLNSDLVHIDLSSSRIIDARISKYLDKLKQIDAMAYHLYYIEKENIKYSIKKIKDDDEQK
tara:strand:- start:4674 stop:4931 length:258 start_codon:yes stop_codon:yes gene_type:complete